MLEKINLTTEEIHSAEKDSLKGDMLNTFQKIKDSKDYEEVMDHPISMVFEHIDDYFRSARVSDSMNDKLMAELGPNADKPIKGLISASTMANGITKIIGGMYNKGNNVLGIGDGPLKQVTEDLKSKHVVTNSTFAISLVTNLDFYEGGRVLEASVEGIQRELEFKGDPTFGEVFQFVEGKIKNGFQRPEDLILASMVINGLSTIERGFSRDVDGYMKENGLNDDGFDQRLKEVTEDKKAKKVDSQNMDFGR